MDTTSTQTQSPTLNAMTEGAVPVIREHIGIRPGYCGGKPHILGHRVKVKHIVEMYERMGMSPAQIVEDIPTISLAQVHSALAYYYDHRAEIEAEIAAEDQAFQAIKAAQPSILEKIRQRMADAQNDSLSPG